MERDTLPIGEFLAELRQRLDALGDRGVRDAIERHARAVRPSERYDFLERFDVSVPAPDEQLLREIDEAIRLLDELEPTHWRRRRHWDDHPDPVHAAAARTVEDLLIATGERFLAGDVAFAATAFDRLFGGLAAALFDDRQLDLQIDPQVLGEARNRWVWCRLHRRSDDLDAAVGTAIERIEQLEPLVSVPGLAHLLAAVPDADQPDDTILRALAHRIRQRLDAGSSWHQRAWLHLMLEIDELCGGLDAVVEFARTDAGSHELETYRWLTDRLVDLDRPADAADVAVEGLDRNQNSYNLAVLADVAVRLLEAVGRLEEALAAAVRAWGAHPTVARLETVLDVSAASAADTASGIVAAATVESFLEAARAIIAGDLDRAVATVSEASFDDYACARLVAAACCKVASPQAPVKDLIETALRSRTRPLDEMGELERNRGRPSQVRRTPLSQRLLDALAEEPRDTRRLETAREIVDAVADRVLSPRDRPHYATAAELIVLIGATGELIDGTPMADTVARYDQQYRRFPAFRSELESAQQAHRS